MRGHRPAALALLALGAALVGGAGPAAAVGDPILPLSEVVPGTVGAARTVIRGTEIVTFPVSVIDVQRSEDGPGGGGSLILARASGPLIASTGGVAQGMSGSPVYVTGADGVARVMGAIAYGTGDEENVVIGVTPIEQMIDSSSGQRANAVGPRASRRATVVRDRAAARALERRSPDRIGVYPLARWTVAGASRPLIAPLADELRRSGIQLTAIGPRTPRPPTPLVPGSSMTTLLLGGDITLGAVGTVTYVNGPTVIGFGHAFLGAGRARFLLGDGYVYQTIAAPITGTSYKNAEPGTLQGMVIGDRADGVTGSLGPVEGIAATATAVNRGRGTRSTVRSIIAPDPRTAPLVAGVVQDEPAVRVRDGIGGGTLTLRVRIASPALPRPVTYRNVYASVGDVVTLASGQAPRLLAILLQNSVRAVPITSLAITQTLEPQVRAARITGASISPRTVRPGGRATLVVRLQPWRSAARSVRVGFRVPRSLERGGPAGLRVLPNAEGGFDPLPADLTQSVGASSGLAARTAAVRAAEGAAARATGGRLARVLAGLRRVTDDRTDAVRVLVPGEDADDPASGVSVPIPYVVYDGRAAVRVRVR